jgi:hemoglobin
MNLSVVALTLRPGRLPLASGLRRGLPARVLSWLLCASLLALMAWPSARAQEVKLPDLTDTYVPARPANDALYRALGGEQGLQTLVDRFMKGLLADQRMNPFFAKIDHAETRKQLALQFCQVSGGPCERKANNRKIHSAMDISRTDFNVLVQVLQQAMDEQAIRFAVQNRLLAQLAPMHRDIINVE